MQYRVYFTLAIYGGFRRGELLALTWRDIDFENNAISINKAMAQTTSGKLITKEPKTQAGNRTIVLPAECFRLLRCWRQEQVKLSMLLGPDWKGTKGSMYDNNHVFIQELNGLMMHMSTPGHKFRKIIDRINANATCEKEKLPYIRLHDLRHTSATLLLAEGIDIETVKQRMGHSKASVTLDVYGHAMKHMDKKAAEALEKMIG